MTEVPFIPDKDTLKRSLPLAYVCAVLGIHLDANLTARCPFHDDDNPSFHLFVGDDGVERWSCMPCGVPADDVLALLMRAEGLSFPEALTRAAHLLAELPDDYAPLPRPEPTFTDLTSILARRSPHGASVALGLLPVPQPGDDEAYEEAAAYDEYLLRRWGIGVDRDDPTLAYLPHKGVDGSVSGVKVRRLGGDKWSVRSSTYPRLYGWWLREDHPGVLLTEGETDAIYAHRNRGDAAVDVLALPSGAQLEPTEVMLQDLRGYETVYLALDPDAAGRAATERWLALLRDLGYPDVRVCALPRGLDLRAAAPSVPALLAAARPVGIDTTGLLVDEDTGAWLVVNARGQPRVVAGWHLEVTAQLIDPREQQHGFEVTLHQGGYSRAGIIVSYSDLSTLARFRAWCDRRQFGFVGTDADISRIRARLTRDAVLTPIVFVTEAAGLHTSPPGYGVTGSSYVVPGEDGITGRVPWLFRDAPRNKTLRAGFVRSAHSSHDALQHLHELQEPGITEPLLAWLTAALRRPEVTSFPLLFLSGSSGAGKSTVAKLACELVGSRTTFNLGQTTAHALLLGLGVTTSLPVFIDEWSAHSRADTRLTLQGNVPAVYEGGFAVKGTSDLTIEQKTYPCTAPVMLAGESSFGMDRELDRMITLHVKRSEQRPESLFRLARTPDLSAVGWGLAWFITHHPDLLPPPPAELNVDRVEHNRNVLRWGWATLHAYLDHAASFGEDVPSFPAELTLDELTAAQAERSNSYEEAVRAALGVDYNHAPLAWPDPEGRGTWVRFRFIPAWLKQATDIEIPGNSESMKKHFSDTHSVQESYVTPPNCFKTIKAYLIAGFHADDTGPADPGP